MKIEIDTTRQTIVVHEKVGKTFFNYKLTPEGLEQLAQLSEVKKDELFGRTGGIFTLSVDEEGPGYKLTAYFPRLWDGKIALIVDDFRKVLRVLDFLLGELKEPERKGDNLRYEKIKEGL